MENIYRVRFTNWKHGKEEFFFADENLLNTFVEKYGRFGYTAAVEKIYLQEATK